MEAVALLVKHRALERRASSNHRGRLALPLSHPMSLSRYPRNLNRYPIRALEHRASLCHRGPLALQGNRLGEYLGTWSRPMSLSRYLMNLSHCPIQALEHRAS
jgi:hypothetical protein